MRLYLMQKHLVLFTILPPKLVNVLAKNTRYLAKRNINYKWLILPLPNVPGKYLNAISLPWRGWRLLLLPR